MYDTGLRRSRWLRLAATALGAAAAAGVLLPAGTAQAAVSTVVQANSGTASSAAVQTATAACPRGTRVFGGGGDIVGGGHSVALTTMKPVTGVSGDSFTVTATEDGLGYAGSWNVFAYAVCGTAANLSLQRATLSASGGNRLQVGTQCPAGTAVLGMGAEIAGGSGHAVLNTMLATFGTPGSTAAAFADEHGFAGGWSLTAYAVCGTALPGLSYQFADSAGGNSTGGDKTAIATCPRGTRAYAAGGYISFTTGELHFDRMVPTGSTWNAADVEVREDTDGFANPWFTQVEVICAA
jgi:hypothetical protein